MSEVPMYCPLASPCATPELSAVMLQGHLVHNQLPLSRTLNWAST